MRHPLHVAGRDVKRLARAVVDAREELGLTQEEFRKKGKLSIITVQRVEAGKVSPRTKTFNGLDKAADWPPGTARGILEGRMERPTTKAAEPPDALRDDTERKLWAITELPLDARWSYVLQWRAMQAAGPGRQSQAG
jgi:transcriptional regulator with XRE-family HTH domain